MGLTSYHPIVPPGGHSCVAGSRSQHIVAEPSADARRSGTTRGFFLWWYWYFSQDLLYARAHSELGDLTVSSISRATSMRPDVSGREQSAWQTLPTDQGSRVCAGSQHKGRPISSWHGAIRQRTGVANIDWKGSYAWHNFDHPAGRV